MTSTIPVPCGPGHGPSSRLLPGFDVVPIRVETSTPRGDLCPWWAFPCPAQHGLTDGVTSQVMRGEGNTTVTDHSTEEPISSPEPLTDEQLDEVAGGVNSPAAPPPDAHSMKPYPPWPGSALPKETEDR